MRICLIVALGRITTDQETGELRRIFDRLFGEPAGGRPLYYDLTGSDPDAEMRKGAVLQLLHPSHHAPELKKTRSWSAALDIATQLLETGDHKRDELIVRDHAILKLSGSTGSTP